MSGRVQPHTNKVKLYEVVLSFQVSLFILSRKRRGLVYSVYFDINQIKSNQKFLPRKLRSAPLNLPQVLLICTSVRKINSPNTGSIGVTVLTQRSCLFDGFLYGSGSNWKIKAIDWPLGLGAFLSLSQTPISSG